MSISTMGYNKTWSESVDATIFMVLVLWLQLVCVNEKNGEDMSDNHIFYIYKKRMQISKIRILWLWFTTIMLASSVAIIYKKQT